MRNGPAKCRRPASRFIFVATRRSKASGRLNQRSSSWKYVNGTNLHRREPIYTTVRYGQDRIYIECDREREHFNRARKADSSPLYPGCTQAEFKFHLTCVCESYGTQGCSGSVQLKRRVAEFEIRYITRSSEVAACPPACTTTKATGF